MGKSDMNHKQDFKNYTDTIIQSLKGKFYLEFYENFYLAFSYLYLYLRIFKVIFICI